MKLKLCIIEDSKIVEIFAEKFTANCETFVEAIVFLEENVKLIIHDIVLKEVFKGLNAFIAVIPTTMFAYLENIWFVNSVFKVDSVSANTASIKPLMSISTLNGVKEDLEPINFQSEPNFLLINLNYRHYVIFLSSSLSFK